NVVAQEDIITAEGIVRARKGDVVAKMTTDAKGEAHVTEAYFLTKGADAIRVAGQNFDLTTMSGQTFNRPEEMATKLNPAGQVEVVKKENNLFLTKQGESWTALYNVIEDQAPDGYRLSDEIHGVVIPYQDDHTPLVIGNTTAFDDSQQGKIEISKTEISDGQALPNTKVNIYDVNMKVIFTGITNEKGEVSIQNLPTGKYFYQEMEAPAPYRCSDEVFPFEIKDKVVTRAVMSDRLIMGNLLLSKTANDPDHYKVVTDDGVNKTEYETIPSEGAEFDVKASQDIITPEGIVRARSGDTVAKITTDEKGEAQISEAYFLTKGADATRTDGQIFDLTTMTEQTFERPASIATPVNPAGQAVAVQQEDNLYLTQVDNTWKATYEAVETKAASDRWQLDPQAHGGVAAYQDDHTPVVTDTIKAFDKATEAPFKLSKADITTGKPIPNTEINIYNAKKDCIFTGTTDNEGKLTLSNLPKGDYFYQETKAPEPFLCSDELYPFTITDEGISIEVTMTDKLAKGSVELRKFGQNDIDYVVGQDGTITYQSNVPLAGAEYAIKADRDIVIAGVVRAQKDDTISRIKTDEEGKAVSSEVYYMAGDGNNTRKDQPADISKMDESLIRKEDGLYVGDYYLVETKAPLSYRLSEERLKFTIHYIDDHTAILDTASLQAEDLAKQGGVEIKKTDLSTGAALEGATIKLFDATQKLIYTGISNKQGRIAISGLPEGKYYYQESGAPEGYELDSTLYAFEIKDDAITKCEITNKPISVNTGLDQSNPTLSVVIILVTLSGLTLTTCLNKRR
ncbi:MAG: SpaA isopeptide-forming pilin-related protein, partial [Eubacterium sp.]